MSKLRVAIDFRIDDPRQGVGTAVLALAHGLSRLENIDQEYIFIVRHDCVSWIQPHVSGPCSVVAAPDARFTKLKTRLSKMAFVRKLWLKVRPAVSLLPSSDGFLESLRCDVVHFPSQVAYLTSVPSIFQPWDLQHCHHPEFFSADEVYLRNVRYPAFCHQARYVCIQTEWGKQDLIRQYGIEPAKIVVIRWGTAFEAYRAPPLTFTTSVREKFGLPEEFFLYPAVTWPHKNHELVLHALSELRLSGRPANVVFTGAITPHRERLDSLSRELKVEGNVQFLGFVSNQEIQSIYHLATAMVFPSRFEGLGLPVLEAFRVGLPVLCSSATVLPEVVGRAALLFNPDSSAELVAAMEAVRSPEIAAQLSAEGALVLERYSADKAAQEFASLYEATFRKELRLS